MATTRATRQAWTTDTGVPTGRPAGELHGGLPVALAGTTVALLPDRALWWREERTLLVADVHLGKAETFRSLGLPVPVGPTQATLARLGRLLLACAARRLVVLGDLLHAPQALDARTLEPLRRWREAHAGLDVLLVRGNHDARAGDPPAALGIVPVDAPLSLGPFALWHDPPAPLTGTACGDGRYALAGHLHPAVRVGGRAGDALRVPCFWLGAGVGVLPAFGEFTGASTIVRRPGDRVFGVAGDRVLEIPAVSGR